MTEEAGEVPMVISGAAIIWGEKDIAATPGYCEVGLTNESPNEPASLIIVDEKLLHQYLGIY